MPRMSLANRRTRPRYRPHLFVLEDRLPLGDPILGPLLAMSLIGRQAASPLVPHSTPTAHAPLGAARDTSSESVWATLAPTTNGPFTFTSAAEWQPFPDAADAPAWEDRSPATPRRSLPSSFAEMTIHSGPGQAVPAETPLTTRAGVSSPSFAAPLHVPTADPLFHAVAAQPPVTVLDSAAASPEAKAQVLDNFGRLPLQFEENLGQTDAQVHFLSRGPGYTLFLTATEAVMVLSKSSPEDHADPLHERDPLTRLEPAAPPPKETESAVVRMQVLGGNSTPRVSGVERLPGIVNYFLGNDPAKWQTNVSTYARVEYDEVYPGIDLVYYGKQNQLEYDFVVAPGADPNAIRLGFQGAERVEIDTAGNLIVHAGGQQLRQYRPLVYQQVAGVRREVASQFALDGQQVRFQVAAYDVGWPLVIDPVLSYSTYLGGSGGESVGSYIAVDASTGDAFLTGSTGSTDFPIFNPLQPVYRGTGDAFVTRLRANGSGFVYSTYLGGSSSELSSGIAVDPTTGDAFITGDTYSTDFPTFNPLQPARRLVSDAFVTRLSANGSALVYSTYLGGDAYDWGLAITVNPSTGSAIVTGRTESVNFPTLAPLLPRRGFNDAFVTRLSADGRSLVYSTFLGGNGSDDGIGITVDSNTGDVLVTGYTNSTNFPTANAYQPSLRGRDDAFVTRLNADGRSLDYSTYLGGSGDDYGFGIAVDGAGNAVVTGRTASTDFPTANPYQPSIRGTQAAFVTRLSADGSIPIFSTYLGGSNSDYGSGIAVDGAGNAVVTGTTRATNFPTINPLQPSHGGGLSDAFVAKLRADGSALAYSTYLGGSNSDYGSGIAVDGAGDVFVTGYTNSTNFPTANAYQPSLRGGSDVFMAKISSDRDDDGLLDDWETDGIDVNGDRVIDLNLPALGANPDHKDLFVEVDYMKDATRSHKPDEEPNGTVLPIDPLAAVVTAFANAPVANPDGRQGINLHILVDEALPWKDTVRFWTRGPGQDDDYDDLKSGSNASPPTQGDRCGVRDIDGHFGTRADRMSTNCPNILDARRLVYRYAIFGQMFDESPGSSGIAELELNASGIPLRGGNDFMVALRFGIPGPDNDFEDQARDWARIWGTSFAAEWGDSMAGTFMHELGHTLNLGHGGGDSIHRKPNYLSVMSYSRQFNHSGLALRVHGVPDDTPIRLNRRLDYSRQRLPTLDANRLRERAGIGGLPGELTLYWDRSGTVRVGPTRGGIDWTGDGRIQKTLEQVDINGPEYTGVEFQGHDDWAALDYNFRDSLYFAD